MILISVLDLDYVCFFYSDMLKCLPCVISFFFLSQSVLEDVGESWKLSLDRSKDTEVHNNAMQ